MLLSCTAYSPVVDDVQKQSDIPVLKIDELMVREALGRARKIGLVATVPAGLNMQRQLIDQIATEMGCEIELDAVLKPEAFQALAAGRRDEHDAIVLAEVERLAERNELCCWPRPRWGTSPRRCRRERHGAGACPARRSPSRK